MGDSICAAGETPRYAHFVTSGMVSVVENMLNGDVIEVGLIGHEGLVEAFQLLGDASSPATAFVQVAGMALRMPFADLRREFLQYEPLRALTLSYVQSVGYTSWQLAACNRLHEVEPRMARWLLMVQDRVGASTFLLTQEFLAEMIGARRTTVTLAAQRMQDGGSIRYARGRVHILDRKALEQTACECYAIVAGLTT